MLFAFRRYRYLLKIPRNLQKKKKKPPRTNSRVSGYKINTQRSIPFPYTNSEHAHNEIKNTIYNRAMPKKTKYLNMLLRKHVQSLYAEKCKILMKVTKET